MGYYESIESESQKEIESAHKIVYAKSESLKSNAEFLKSNVLNSSNIGLLDFFAENSGSINQQLEADNDKYQPEIPLPNPSVEGQKKFKEQISSVIDCVNQVKPINVVIGEADTKEYTKSAKKNSDKQ